MKQRKLAVKKNCHILQKQMYFWSFISKVNVTWIQTSWFIFWLFILNAFFSNFFGPGIRMHILFLIVVQKGNITIKKWSYFDKKSLFEAYFLRWWSLVCQCLFYILVFSRALYSLFSFLKLWHTYPHCHLNRGSKWTHQ